MNLESLSRSELQNLVKEYGLKGANKKVSFYGIYLTSIKKNAEIISILKEFLENKENSTLSDIVNTNVDIAPAAGYEETYKENIPENISEEMDSQVEVEEEVVKKDQESVQEVNQETTESNQVHQFLGTIFPSEAELELFVKQDLMQWDLLKNMSIQDMRLLGMTMGNCLRLFMALKSRFSNEYDSPIPQTVSELNLLVESMVQSRLDKMQEKPKRPLIPYPIHSTNKTMNVLKSANPTLNKKPIDKPEIKPFNPKKYSSVKSVVSSFRKPTSA